MCELSVLLEGKKVFDDVIYAKTDGDKGILKNVLGASKALENCKITEIDVSAERLVLSSL